MMRKKIHRPRGSRGVALLFALGILSLLLVLGLAFVANAIIAQKVAFNNSTRTQAKMLAQSAISRAATAIMLYQYQAQQLPASRKFWPTEFTTVYSVDGDIDAEDQLRYSSNQLNQQFSKLNYFGNVVGYTADDSKAKWAFIYDKAEDESAGDISSSGQQTSRSRKIIGRIAYQVLPPMSNSRLNLSRVLKGAADRPEDITTQERMGVDIGEINVDDTTVFTDHATPSSSLRNLLDPSNSPAYYGERYTAYQTNFFDGTDSDRARDWIERWFSEGTQPADFEAFLFEDGSRQNYAYRFNLGGTDWNTRFNTANNGVDNSNSEDRVEFLADDAIIFKEQARNIPADTGLPFLKSIADTPGSFSSLELRRKQIVANLNDFCDDDSIPTSNIAATGWLNAIEGDESGWPEFTGNEKTWYINEVALGLEVEPTITVTVEAGKTRVDRAEVSVNIRPEYLAEIINIYGSTTPANYTFATRLNQLDVTVRVTVNGHITYTLTDPATGATTNQEVQIERRSVDAQTLSMSADADRDVRIDFEGISAAGGYKAGSRELTTTTGGASTDFLTPVTFDFLSEFDIPDPGAQKISIVAAEITSIRFEITDVKFRLGPMVLHDNTTEQIGADFVRVPCGDTDTLPASGTTLTYNLFNRTEPFVDPVSGDALDPAEGWVAVSGTGVDIPANSNNIYIGGIMVRDPRQNLNLKLAPATTAESDWKIKLGITGFENNETPQRITMDFSDKYAGGTITGKVNHCSNPASPEDYTDPSAIDMETVTDPAWIDAVKHISTAVIADAPMKSLWELGMIHRGAAWETINLKLAGSPANPSDRIQLSDHAISKDWNATAGTSYQSGDGGILDEVTISDSNTAPARTYGKLDVNMLWDSTENTNRGDYDEDLIKALFQNLRYDQNAAAFNDNGIPATTSGTLLTGDDAYYSDVQTRFMQDDGDRPFESRAQFLDWGVDYCLGNAFGLLTPDNDAQQEEIIGKTINLLNASTGALPNVVQVLIVAQTIRDVGGDGSDVNITKLRYDGTAISRDCRLGQFDIESDATAPSNSPDQHIYFDEITGEVKIIATLDRNPTNGKMMLRKIEYID